MVLLRLGLVTVSVITILCEDAYCEPKVTEFDNDGMITVNGQRTFIIGSYSAQSKYLNRPISEGLTELAETGFNLVNAGSTTDMDAAHAAGLMTWTAVGTLDMAKRAESEKTLRERVAAIKDHPALAFIETVDEPAWTWKSAEIRVPAKPFVEAYPIIKEIDPNHLLYMNHAPTNLVKTMRAYNGGTDIVAMDIYPVNPGDLKEMYALFEDGHQGDLNNTYISQVGDYVDKMREVTGPDRPLFMVLQAFAWEMLRDEAERDENKVLYPTYDESRFMAFQSIIKGVNGIIYWGSHYTPQPSPFWTELKRVVREVADLEEVLSQPVSKQTLSLDYHEMGHSVHYGVQTLVKECNGKLYLFTCNADKNPCKATITGIDAWKSVRVLNEKRDNALALEAGSITDTWRPFDVHVYELTK